MCSIQFDKGKDLKSPATRLFTHPSIQAQIKEDIKSPRHWPLCGEFTGEFYPDVVIRGESWCILYVLNSIKKRKIHKKLRVFSGQGI